MYTPVVLRNFASHELAPTDGKGSSMILALRRQNNLFLLPLFHVSKYQGNERKESDESASNRTKL